MPYKLKLTDMKTLNLIITTAIISLISLNAFSQDLPLSLSNTDVFWYSASSLTSFNDGDRIQTWVDLSGRNNNAFQTTQGKRPILTIEDEGTINGQATLFFNGANSSFNLNNTTDINTGSNYTEKSLMLIFRTSDEIENMQVIYEEGGTTRGFNLYIYEEKLYTGVWNRANDAGTSASYYDVVSIDAPVEINKDYMVEVVFDSNNDTFSLFVNGQLANSTSGIGTIYAHGGNIGIGGVSGYTRTHIGDRQHSHFEGYIGEALFFETALDQEELDSLETNIGFPYGFGSDGILPVEMISFSATNDDNEILVNWATASEINNDYFTIERSDDMENWYTVGTVTGSGNTSTRTDYEYVDYTPVYGTTYYRITQTDFDGTTEVFGAMVVENKELNANLELLSLNSQAGNVSVQFNTATTEATTISIYSTSGILVNETTVYPNQGNNTVNINANISGIGIINITQANNNISEKTFISSL